MKRTFVIAAGGTGGHVIPALQVAEELRRRGHECVFVGTERGLEKNLVPKAGFPVEFLRVGGINRLSLARQLRALAQLPGSIWAAWKILSRTRASAVLSLGGYASGPASAAAWLKGVPVAVMEPNAYPGLANRLAGRWARRALLGFAEAAKHFPKGRSETIGTPIRPEFFAIEPKTHGSPATVLITGGSLGARTLNDAVVEAAKIWAAKGFPGGLRLVHQAGKSDYERVQAEYDKLKFGKEIRVQAMRFIDDMPAAFAQADIVVCRSGASAVAELAAAGKASVLVPFPHAADDHQLRNAEAMVNAGAARLVPDREWNGARMVEEIGRLLGVAGRLEAMEEAARKQARPGVAALAADCLEEIALEGEKKK